MLTDEEKELCKQIVQLDPHADPDLLSELLAELLQRMRERPKAAA